MESAKLLWPTLKYSNQSLSKNLMQRHNCCVNSFWRKYATENSEAQEIVSTKKIQLTKPSVVKWKRPPFLKNFFVGKFDTELMAFPEILDKEQVAELENTGKDLNRFMRQKVNSYEIDKNAEIPKDVLQELKEMGLFGRIIPAKYGGLSLTHTASTRLSEVLGLDWSVASTIASHEFYATETILQFGTEAQKSQYLPKLASGELIGALCCSELESGSDLLAMSAVAKKTAEGTYILNGNKSWVTNAGIAGVYIVFAKTKSELDPKESDISVFLVEKNTKGVNVALHDKVCLRGVQTGMVRFDDVIIPSSNVIGQLGQGFQIYLKSLESFRIAMNSFTFGALKAFLDSVTDQIIHRERLDTSLADFQLVRTRLSRITSMIYGMESAAYFTAAILDSTENPDIALESAALKIFNSEGTLYCLRELMEVLGAASLMPGSQLEKFHRDALGLAIYDTPNDIVRLYLGLTGCKYLGEHEVEHIKKIRNSFYFPSYIVRNAIRQYRFKYNAMKYEQDIAGYIHPSLVEWGNELEKNLLAFQVATQSILKDHGTKVVETQIDPKKLASIATEMYVWSAVLSRCSRSYCYGMKNCHHELRLASAFCHDSNLRIAQNLKDIFMGGAKNNERTHLLQGEQVVDCQGYFPEHPLKHNF